MTGSARHRMLAACLLVTFGACVNSAEKPKADPGRKADPLVLRGTLLVRDSTTLIFIACGTTAERPLEPTPGSQVMEALVAVNGSVRDSIFLAFEADTSKGRLRARSARYATDFVEGGRCDRPRLVGDWEASGTEPFWRVTVDGTLLVLERAEAPLEIAFVADTPVVRGELTTYRAHRADGRVRELQFGVLREACRDGASAAWYPYRAEVRFGSTALHGCARR
jgi:uncharacterized membrane protein